MNAPSPELTAKTWTAFATLAPQLVEEARQAAQHADSYRGFGVGAVAVAQSKSGDLGLFSAANFKPYKDGPKECAEKAVLKKVAEHKFDRVLAIIVSGSDQVDAHSGLDLPTLHPCSDCRGLFSQSDLMDANQSLIMPVRLDEDTFEMYTPAELEALHNTGDSPDVPDIFAHYNDPGFRTWEAGATGFNIFAGLPMTTVIPGAENLIDAQFVRQVVTGQLAA